MTGLKLLSVGMIVAAALASPVTARERHVSRSVADNAYAASPAAAKRGCDRAPRVGAYATQPYKRPPCEPTQGY
jgi:hypothetical protein